MADLVIRPAAPSDAAGITAVHCSHIARWRRGGKGEDAAYESLSLYDRWLHGGPWMSVETCREHLRRWSRFGLILVAERDGEVVGEAEFLENREPAPYGPSLHLSLLFVHAAHRQRGIGRALVEAGETLARERGCAALTTQPEREAEPFYAQVGFEPWLWLQEWQAPVRPTAPPPADPAPAAPYPEGTVLRAGRYQCGRQAWEDLPPRVPGRQLVWGRWRLPLPDGSTAWLGLRAQPLEPAQADGLVWTRPGADLEPALEALQTLAGHLGFAALDLLLEEPEGGELARRRGWAFQTAISLWRKGAVEQGTRASRPHGAREQRSKRR